MEIAAGIWPGGDAWRAQEIDRFQQRLALLTDRGLSLDEAEALAESLLRRDREQDGRGVCLECVHYIRGRCDNSRRSGVGAVGELRDKLQRCPGFSPAIQQEYGSAIRGWPG